MDLALGLEDRPVPDKGPWPRWLPDVDHLDDSCGRRCDDHDSRSYDHDNCSDDHHNRSNDHHNRSNDDDDRGDYHYDRCDNDNDRVVASNDDRYNNSPRRGAGPNGLPRPSRGGFRPKCPVASH